MSRRSTRPVDVVLGISADYHDAAAALLVGGELVAAAEEERFTRRKHDPSMPRHAIAWCLEDAGVGPGELDLVAFYDKPLTTYERILVTHASVGPRGVAALADAVVAFTRRKLWTAYRIDRLLRSLGQSGVPLRYAEHHMSHAAAAFLPSPFERAAVLTFDGVGEWATASIAHGRGNRVEPLRHIDFPDSLGLFYSAMTAYCGFAVNDGEFKLMGLAPYGEPRFAKVLRDRVVHLNGDGSFELDQRWFDYRAGRRMTSARMAELLEGPPREAGEPLRQREADIAASAQVVLEDAVLGIARRAHELTGERRACLAGGVALNCVANRRLLDDGPFEEIWVQPAAGDDGGSVGAAMWAWHDLLGNDRSEPRGDAMRGAFLGPGYSRSEVRDWLTAAGVAHDVPSSDEEFRARVADELARGALVGWFEGRMEFGPRALGHRSILADPRDPSVVRRLNLAVKGREGFRPFAPAVLVERAAEWFDLPAGSPYMLFTAPLRAEHRRAVTAGGDFGEQLSAPRSVIPACTHVDHSARVQTVEREVNPGFWGLLSAFESRTGCPVLVNTSFNRDGEPIVRTPADALACFRAADLDLLVMEGCIVSRSDDRGGR